MEYIKLNLKDGQKLNQEHLAHIEAGIADNDAELAEKATKEELKNFATKDDVKEIIEAMEDEQPEMVALTTEEILNICK